MSAINRKNQEVLLLANKHGIELTPLRKMYKLPFAVKFFKYVLQRTEKNKGVKKVKSFELIYPKKFEYEDYDDYIETLEDCGFKFKRWVEPFIDEDTGKVVGIRRHYVKAL